MPPCTHPLQMGYTENNTPFAGMGDFKKGTMLRNIQFEGAAKL